MPSSHIHDICPFSISLKGNRENVLSSTILALLMTICSATFSSGLIGMAGGLHTSCMGLVLRSQSFGGVFISAVVIVLISIPANLDTITKGFFNLALLFNVVAFLSLVYMVNSKYVRQYSILCSTTPCPESEPLLPPPPLPPDKKRSLMEIAKRIKIQLVTIFLVFTVTISCFPVLTDLVVSVGGAVNDGGTWEKIFFVPTCCFLGFTISDFVGRILSFFFPRPLSPTRWCSSSARPPPSSSAPPYPPPTYTTSPTSASTLYPASTSASTFHT